MSLTYFMAELTCPVCGRTSPSDSSTDLVTPLVSGGMTFWTVGGTDPAFGWPSIRGWYPTLREPDPDEPVRLLARWECPHCHAVNWARITFTGTTVTAIEAVPLDAPTVAAAHAVDWEVAEDYGKLTGTSLFPEPGMRTGFRDRLIAALDQAQ